MSVLASVSTFVAQIPNPPPQAPPGLENVSNMVLGWLKWGGLIAGVGTLIYCGIMIIVGRRNRNQMATDGVIGIPWVLAGLAVIGIASALVGMVAG